MEYAIGIIIGLVIAVISMLSVRRYQTPIERMAKRAENMTKEKGEIFAPNEDEEELKHFINSLPTEHHV